MPIPAGVRYRPAMPQIRPTVTTIRTTSNSDGRPRGILTGMASNPEAALARLSKNARDYVTAGAESDLLSTYSTSGATSTPSVYARMDVLEWRWEVVDVRLVPGPVGMESDETGTGWGAYGTLISLTE